MAAAAGIVAGAGQFRVVVISAAIGLLVLTAASLLERLMPHGRAREERKMDENSEPTRMPNRRGATHASH
jgi:hypothetical protein